MLAIDSKAEYDEVVTGWEWHTHKAYASNTFQNNDEIRIPISQTDVITAPYESMLHITGTISGKKNAADAEISLVNNAMAFLFDDIRYEISGVEIDRTKNVGITSTMKNLLSLRPEELVNVKNACWLGPGNVKAKVKNFTFSVPLKHLLGVAEDYKRIVVNVRQELILLRSATDINAMVAADATSATLTITGLYWRVPHVSLADEYRLKLFKMVDKDMPVHIPFRSWELHEYPTLPQTTRQSWSIKTSSHLEKPRYVILAFQTDRKNKLEKDASQFDPCDLTELKLYLNSNYYPYDNVRGDYCIFYEMFTQFAKSYYERSGNGCTVEFDTFKTATPLFVINCSKQVENLKSGPVDVRLEFEAKNNFPEKTTAYCLLLHDSHLVYTLLTGSVKKMM